MSNLNQPFMADSVKSVGSAAMLLALTRTIADEDTVKKMLIVQGYKVVVTEVGGNAALFEFQTKLTKAVLGAALNTGVIAKTPTDCHALLHATDEAKKGLMINMVSSASVAVKIAIVRDEKWLAVALFGESAIHHLTNHERAGLGIMHLGTQN